MKNSEDLLFETQARKRASSKKVAELNQKLAGEGKQSSDFLSSNSLAIALFQRAPVEFLEARTLDELFQRAPVEFLEARTLDELVHITKRGLDLLSKAYKHTGVAQLHIETVGTKTGLWIALTDRPFIVTSVSRMLLAEGHHVRVYLHPILNHQGTNISLSYVETDHLSAEQQALLERKVTAVLNQLTKVTDDFSQMLVQTETLAKIMESTSHSSPFPESDRREVAAFLRWLTDGGYVFVGYVNRKIVGSSELQEKPSLALGIAASSDQQHQTLLSECLEDGTRLLQSDQLLLVSRLSLDSPVHRHSRLIVISVQEFNSGGNVTGVHSLIGLLTSKSVAQEASTIPLIRRKVKEILEIEDVVVNSHSYKTIIEVIDSMPKEEALRLGIDELRGILHTVYDMENRSETRVTVKFDAARRGASLFVVMPRERFNTEVRARLQEHLESSFGAVSGSAEYHVDLTNKPQVKFYYYIPLTSGSTRELDLARLETELAALTRTWTDGFQERVFADKNFSDPRAIWLRYEDAFPAEYQALHSVEKAEQDIRAIEKLSSDHPFSLHLQHDSVYTLVLYALGRNVTLSQALPVLENAGLEAIEEHSTRVTPRGLAEVNIHRFVVRSRSGAELNTKDFNDTAAKDMAQVFSGAAENDVLNKLIVSSGFSLRQVALLRTYCNFLWQISGFASPQTITETVAADPAAARLLWTLFETRFDPQAKDSKETRLTKSDQIQKQIVDHLRSVTDITKDRILRSIRAIMLHTVRTNYYLGKNTIAIKIHSEKAEFIPNPRPLYEIFVYSPFVEGVHLRMGRVARGGIRWSDRYEDYRSEVLGLVKTQKIKNAIIVPTGAKGGFVVKGLPTDPAAVRTTVQEAYREFVRSLLSITDNRTAKGVSHPEGVVVLDGEDPYFVVAADKGTATFSDTANKIAVEEYNFWLGDAFASGGSQGYDHKLYGITAKGGWECVKRHFNDLGINYTTAPFTAVGIGDLAGDVFGNGLILSNQFKMIAAFNHAHIFIDPNPDPARSFTERLRMFNLPRSQWTDYDKNVISNGGGIFGRMDKEITLSPEARIALGIAETEPATMSGEQVINHILKAPVDLLWNGGIGTYIKASTEAHAQVQDRANDRVRVSATEVRAKVIGEGGNLGVTQRGRNEFAALGGRLNLDAIDNSGGVDLSDHEVNLKILFSELLRDKKITLEERNKLLKEMADWVVEDVLNHNRDVSLAITLGEYRSKKNMPYFLNLIREVHKNGYVDRVLEVLPDDEEIMSRTAEGKGLLRPELAVCLNAVKLWMKDVINNSNLAKEPILRKFLLEYFPPVLHQRFRDYILKHPLADNIIAMQMASSLIASVGVSFVHRMCIAHSAAPQTVIKCTLAADMLLGMQEVRAALAAFDDGKDNLRFLELRRDHNRAIRHATAWLIANHGDSLSLEDLVAQYDSEYRELKESADTILQGRVREQYQALVKHFEGLGLKSSIAKGLALFPGIEIVLEMLATTKRVKRPISEVARIFGQIFEELRLSEVLAFEKEAKPANKWETELLGAAFNDIRKSASTLTTTLIDRKILGTAVVQETLQASHSFVAYRALLDEIGSKYPGVAGLSVVAKQLRQFKL